MPDTPTPITFTPESPIGPVPASFVEVDAEYDESYLYDESDSYDDGYDILSESGNAFRPHRRWDNALEVSAIFTYGTSTYGGNAYGNSLIPDYNLIIFQAQQSEGFTP